MPAALNYFVNNMVIAEGANPTHGINVRGLWGWFLGASHGSTLAHGDAQYGLVDIYNSEGLSVSGCGRAGSV